MYKPYNFLSLPVLVLFLTGCAGNAAAQENQVTPTSLPATAEPTTTPEVVSKEPPASCPVTVPQEPPFVPPAQYLPNGPFPDWFWYGSKSLWVAIPSGSVWHPMPNNTEGYFDKMFWWREGYV